MCRDILNSVVLSGQDNTKLSPMVSTHTPPSLLLPFNNLIFFRVCKFSDPKRGEITFRGNLLFTPFGEIGAPQAVSRPEDEDLQLDPIINTQSVDTEYVAAPN